MLIPLARCGVFFLFFLQLFFNQYVNPIAFGAMGYRYYYVYIGMIFVSLVVIYFTFPETQGLTRESLVAAASAC